MHDIVYRNISIETRYEAFPSWWGAGEPIWISTEARQLGDVVGRTYNVLFENITARSGEGAWRAKLPKVDLNVCRPGDRRISRSPRCLPPSLHTLDGRERRHGVGAVSPGEQRHVPRREHHD